MRPVLGPHGASSCRLDVPMGSDAIVVDRRSVMGSVMMRAMGRGCVRLASFLTSRRALRGRLFKPGRGGVLNVFGTSLCLARGYRRCPGRCASCRRFPKFTPWGPARAQSSGSIDRVLDPAVLTSRPSRLILATAVHVVTGDVAWLGALRAVGIGLDGARLARVDLGEPGCGTAADRQAPVWRADGGPSFPPAALCLWAKQDAGPRDRGRRRVLLCRGRRSGRARWVLFRLLQVVFRWRVG